MKRIVTEIILLPDQLDLYGINSDTGIIIKLIDEGAGEFIEAKCQTDSEVLRLDKSEFDDFIEACKFLVNQHND